GRRRAVPWEVSPHASNSNSHRLRRTRIGAFGLAAAGPRPESAAVAAQCGPPNADEQACAGYTAPEEESVMKRSRSDCNGGIGRRDAGVKCSTSDPRPDWDAALVRDDVAVPDALSAQSVQLQPAASASME